MAEDGRELTPGWRVGVGTTNYERVFTDDRLAGPLASVAVWSFAFALLSVVSTFFLGVLLALVFDNPRMRGRKVYRSLLLLPYAAPAFMSMLLWAGFLNPSFGFVNQVLLGGAEVPWLTDPWLAKLSVLVVNLWLGFPYMFLVCTGALQSIPGDIKEAARVDGASAFRVFRSIVLPLLMVSVAPLLIASFAFNFNNFTLIYFVTGGGPNIPEASISIGSTDLLIHVVYTLGFESGGGQQWGFACALAILIFFVVAGDLGDQLPADPCARRHQLRGWTWSSPPPPGRPSPRPAPRPGAPAARRSRAGSATRAGATSSAWPSSSSCCSRSSSSSAPRSTRWAR